MIREEHGGGGGVHPLRKDSVKPTLRTNAATCVPLLLSLLEALSFSYFILFSCIISRNLENISHMTFKVYPSQV